MINYTRKVERTDTGMIVAEVYRLYDGKRIALKFFSQGFLRSIIFSACTKKEYIKAHAWCGKVIEQAEEYEVSL